MKWLGAGAVIRSTVHVSSFPTLTTARLVLRPFRMEDAGRVFSLAGDALIADTTLNIPHPYLEGMAEEWIATHEGSHAAGKGLTLAITLHENDALIGAISLLGRERDHQAELGYWIGVPYWNHGYCTEAAVALINHAFAGMHLLRVHSCHLARNPSSGKVMQKIGLLPEGVRRQHVIKHGKPEDLCLYGILRSDWE